MENCSNKKWNRIYHQKFEAYRNEDGDIVYRFNEDNKYEVVLFPLHGLRQRLYYGLSEKVANNWLNKIMGGKDES